MSCGPRATSPPVKSTCGNLHGSNYELEPLEPKPRFVVADPEISNEFNTHTVIMLGDISYWLDNYDALERWCAMHRGRVVGMTVELPDAETVTAFCLRWS